MSISKESKQLIENLVSASGATGTKATTMVSTMITGFHLGVCEQMRENHAELAILKEKLNAARLSLRKGEQIDFGKE